MNEPAWVYGLKYTGTDPNYYLSEVCWAERACTICECDIIWLSVRARPVSSLSFSCVKDTHAHQCARDTLVKDDGEGGLDRSSRMFLTVANERAAVGLFHTTCERSTLCRAVKTSGSFTTPSLFLPASFYWSFVMTAQNPAINCRCRCVHRLSSSGEPINKQYFADKTTQWKVIKPRRTRGQNRSWPPPKNVVFLYFIYEMAFSVNMQFAC